MSHLDSDSNLGDQIEQAGIPKADHRLETDVLDYRKGAAYTIEVVPVRKRARPCDGPGFAALRVSGEAHVEDAKVLVQCCFATAKRGALSPKCIARESAGQVQPI